MLLFFLVTSNVTIVYEYCWARPFTEGALGSWEMWVKREVYKAALRLLEILLMAFLVKYDF